LKTWDRFDPGERAPIDLRVPDSLRAILSLLEEIVLNASPLNAEEMRRFGERLFEYVVVLDVPADAEARPE
jgi:hypothetical protein